MRTTILLLLVVLFSGCDRFSQSEYEISKADNGQFYRLNKSNGQVSLIEGYNITILKEPSDKVSEAKFWPEITLTSLDSVRLTLKTMWKEGMMYYILNASPYNGRIAYAQGNSTSNATLTIHMMDASGFYLLTIPVPLSSMTRVVDNIGFPTELSVNYNIPCTYDTYLSLSSWTCNWNF